MITFIKNDKYISFLNFLIVIVFLLFEVSYYWFLLIELTIIIVFLIFMLFRFYIRSKIKYSELESVNELRKIHFKYDNYKDIYEEIDDFDLEMKGYQKLLESISINFLRMDNKLDIIDYDVVNQGLVFLEKNIKKDENRQKDYDVVKEGITVIKKYYDDKGIRKDKTKKHKKMLLISLVLLLITIALVVIYLITMKMTIFSIASPIFIVLLIIANILLSNINK